MEDRKSSVHSSRVHKGSTGPGYLDLSLNDKYKI